MEPLTLTVRPARIADAADIGRIYRESWQDTYPGVIPAALLTAMTVRGQTARWRAAIAARGHEAVFIAEDEKNGIVGMMSFGPSRDDSLGLDGEVYTLYVDPAHYSCGAGRALLTNGFAALKQRGYKSCIIWAHARNPARFFYERMGGHLVAERTIRMLGDAVPEAGFGWKRLAVAEKSSA